MVFASCWSVIVLLFNAVVILYPPKHIFLGVSPEFTLPPKTPNGPFTVAISQEQLYKKFMRLISK
jgi:hypothetical protein